jgi:hypothetical protein
MPRKTRSTAKSKTDKKAAKAPEAKPEVEAEDAAPVEPMGDDAVTAPAKPAPEPTPEPEPEAAPEPEPAPKSTVAGPDGGFGVPSDEPLAKKSEPRIRLKNLRNRRVDITLEHAVYCAEIGRCVCSKRDVVRARPIERKSKAMAHRIESILIAKSIILGPLGTSEPLHAAAKKCADVKAKLVNRPQKLQILPA